MSLLTISTISLVFTLTFLCDPLHAGQGSLPLVKLTSYHISKRAVHTVSDKFMSFTVDPHAIKYIPSCHQITNATITMARTLTPSYIRIAGSDSNTFLFQNNPNTNSTELSANSPKRFSVSSAQWLQLNEFFSKIGMNVIASVSGVPESGNRNWDLSNILELITFSEKHNISLDWQLGYELQRLGLNQGKIMGHDVARLRKILDVFPRYRDSLIIGPDMTSFSTREDAAFVRNYLTEAGDALNVFTWHPFSGDEEDDIYEMLSNGMTTMDNYLWIKDGVLKSTSKGVVPKKSIWIAESEVKSSAPNLIGMMTWIKRMGASARLGASVYLRKPHPLSFNEPTLEYWVAVLFKSLVGKTVLDIKQVAGNGTNKIQMFSHCTQISDKPEGTIINPIVAYERGSITVYGVNTAPESARISLKVGLKGDETAHLYILSEDNRGNFPKTLLNKQPLDFSPDNELPMVSPKIRVSPKYLAIPARSIFFVVLPDTKCRVCNQQAIEQDSTKWQNKVQEEEDDQDTNTFTNSVLEVMEDENDHDAVYVSYPKREGNNMLKIHDKMFPGTNDKSEPISINTKFVTISDDTWFSSFPEKLKEAFDKEKENSMDKKYGSKAEKYRILAQAILGKRNVTATQPRLENSATKFVLDDDSQINNLFKRTTKYSGDRLKRAIDEPSLPSPQKSANTVTNTGNKRSIHEIYVLPFNNENTPEITKALESGQFKETIPILSIMKKPNLQDFKSFNDRMKRSTSQQENSTTPIIEKTSQSTANPIPNSNTSLSTNSSNRSVEVTQPTSQPPSTTTTESQNLRTNMTMDSEILLESENSTMSRGYREIAKKSKDQVDDAIIGTARADKSNSRPVSPFPKKQKNLKSKSKNAKPNSSSENTEMISQTSKTTPTQETHVASAQPSSKAVHTSPDLTHGHVAPSPQDDVAVSHEISSLFSRNADLVLESTTLAPIVSQSNIEEVADDLVSKPKPAIPHNSETIAEQNIEKLRQKIASLVDTIKSKHATKPAPLNTKSNSKTPLNAAQIHELAQQKVKEILERNNAKIEELKKRLVKPDPRIHKREIFSDMYDATENFFNDAKEKFSNGYKKVTHWIGDRSLDLGIELKRTRRDISADMVAAPRHVKNSPKQDKDVKNLKELIEARKIEINQLRQKLVEERKIKKSHPVKNSPTRPKRDLQKIKDKIQNLKDQRETRREKLIEENKQKKSNHPSHVTSIRSKREAQNLREKLNEVQKQIQERHAELRKKKENRIEDKKTNTPANHTPTKSKSNPLKTEESHPVPRSEDEARYAPRSENQRHVAANKTSKSAHKTSTKQKSHHINRRDLNENQLGDNAGSDLMKDLHFRYFVDPVLNARDDTPLDPIPSDQFERRKRSLTDNEIFDDEDNNQANEIHIGDKVYRKIKLNRVSDLDKMKRDFDSLNINASKTALVVPVKVKHGNDKSIDSTTTKASKFDYEEDYYVVSDPYSSSNATKNTDSSSSDNRTCQLVNYNVFNYFWCVVTKMFYYLV